MARYDVLTDPDENDYVFLVMYRASALEALRLAWRIFRQPERYRMLIRAHRRWVERHCTPVTAGNSFDAPLGKG